MDYENKSIKDNLPMALKNMRACLRCHIIQNADQWSKNGCPNCIVYQGTKYTSYTTNKFEGFLGIMKPRESWLARSRTFHRNVPGVYCLKAFGVLDDDMNED